MKFEQARSGWLNTRYSPDLHQSGQIESDLQLRLDGSASHPKWLKEVSQLRILLEEAHVAILRLRRYPQFMQRDDAEALIKATEEWLISAIAEQQELERRVAPGNTFPLLNVSSRKRMLRDWRATVFWAGDELKTVTYKDLTEPWYKDEL